MNRGGHVSALDPVWSQFSFRQGRHGRPLLTLFDNEVQRLKLVAGDLDIDALGEAVVPCRQLIH